MGERAGEEHHVHVRQPQEMTNDEHQREGQVGGELERGNRKAEEYHVVTNTASKAAARGRPMEVAQVVAYSEAQLRHDDAAHQ